MRKPTEVQNCWKIKRKCYSKQKKKSQRKKKQEGKENKALALGNQQLIEILELKSKKIKKKSFLKKKYKNRF